jgi:hypothetical protein
MKSSSLVLVNTIFFGIAGSYIGGLIILLIWTTLTSSYSHALQNFLISPIIGFIPGSLTGFLYSLTYITSKKRSGILIAGLYGSFVTGFIGGALSLSSPNYTYDANYKQSIDYMAVIERVAVFSLLGAVCAIACAILIGRWNKNWS